MRFSRRAFWVLTAVILFTAGSLIVSGHVPARGHVTGYVRLCPEGRCANAEIVSSAMLVFESMDGSRGFVAVTDRTGRFDITLPAGSYHVQSEYLVPTDAQGHPGGARREDFPEGPRIVSVQAGQLLEVDYGINFYRQ
jgi:hypothetical protein